MVTDLQCPIYPLYPRLDIKLFASCLQSCCRGYATTSLAACCPRNRSSSALSPPSLSNDFIFQEGRDDYYADVKTALSVIFGIIGCFVIAPFLIITFLYLVKKCVNKKISNSTRREEEPPTTTTTTTTIDYDIWTTSLDRILANEPPPSYTSIKREVEKQAASSSHHSKLPTYSSVMNLRTTPVEI